MKGLALLDYCQPDYFSGYHKPVIAVPVYGSMTNNEVADAILDELSACFDMYDEETEQAADFYCALLRENGDDIFIQEETIPEDWDCAYMYFGVINPLTVNGITFLNP